MIKRTIFYENNLNIAQLITPRSYPPSTHAMSELRLRTPLAWLRLVALGEGVDFIEHVATAMAQGRVSRGRSSFGLERMANAGVADLRTQVSRLEEGRRAAALMRSNPDFQSHVGALVLRLIDQDQACTDN